MKKYTILLLLLGGCGDSSSTVPNIQSVDTNTINTLATERLKSYKELCIDNNLPLIESTRLDCMRFYSQALCQNHADANLQRINNEWDSIEADARAGLLSCMADFRVNFDYCFSAGEVETARRSGLCHEVIQIQ